MFSNKDILQLIALIVGIIIILMVANAYANPLENKIILNKIKKAGFENKGNGIFVCNRQKDEIKECLIIKNVYLENLIDKSLISFVCWFIQPPKFAKVEVSVGRLIIEPVLQNDIEEIIKVFRKKAKNKAKQLFQQLEKRKLFRKKGAKEA